MTTWSWISMPWVAGWAGTPAGLQAAASMPYLASKWGITAMVKTKRNLRVIWTLSKHIENLSEQNLLILISRKIGIQPCNSLQLTLFTSWGWVLSLVSASAWSVAHWMQGPNWPWRKQGSGGPRTARMVIDQMGLWALEHLSLSVELAWVEVALGENRAPCCVRWGPRWGRCDAADFGAAFWTSGHPVMSWWSLRKFQDFLDWWSISRWLEYAATVECYIILKLYSSD